MTGSSVFASIIVALLCIAPTRVAKSQSSLTQPETVAVQSGTLRLNALLWRPAGPGPFPAIVFNHGTGAKPIDSAQAQTAARSGFGAPFQKHGYMLLSVFRRGQGLSRGQGTPIQDAIAAGGGLESEAGVHVLDSLLRTEQVDDVLAGVAYLRSRPDVARDRVSVMGHSQGAMLAILAGARDSTLRTVIDFAGAEKGWSSPAMRTLLTDATMTLCVPLLMVHAENGNPAPGRAMDEIMTQRGVPHRLVIYPPFGKTAEDAHRLVLIASSLWEPDVFAFLDQYSRPPVDRSGR